MTFYTLINYFKKLILCFLFTIPDKIVFKDFAYFLGTANLRNNLLLVRTILVRPISIACTIPCQKLIVPNLIFSGVVLGRRLGKITALNHFTKPER